MSADEPLILTGQRRVVWSNQAAARLFGVASDQLLGRPMKELLAAPPKVGMEICRSISARGYRSGNIDVVTGTGKTISTRYRGFSLGGAELHLVAFGSPGDRVGTRERSEPSIGDLPRRELPRSAEIAAAIGHEIRTPLATALMYMGIVKKQLDAGARRGPVRSALATAQHEVSRIERLVARVAEMQGFGFPVMRPRLVDLGRVVTETVQRSLPGLGTDVVRIDIRPGNFFDWWDDGAVEQILQNLLSNAVKFGEGREVEVAVARVDDRARIAVRDRGIGIRASEQPHIFERRARSALSRAPGLGLGLWFVRALAEAHGGVAAVRSRPGDGATFTVTIKSFRPGP